MEENEMSYIHKERMAIDQAIEKIRSTGIVNLFFIFLSLICTIGIFLYRSETYQVLVGGIGAFLVITDWLIGFIFVKFKKTTHKTLLKLVISRFIMFSLSFTLAIIMLNFGNGNGNKMLIHIIIYFVFVIGSIPYFMKFVLKEENKKLTKLNAMAGGLIGGCGIIGMLFSRVMSGLGGNQLIGIFLFYIAVFVCVLMNLAICIYVQQYRYYEEVYTKEVIEEFKKYEKKIKFNDPKKTY